MTDLSPTARKVLDAFLGDAEHTGLQMDDMRENVAAALWAAADQVVPISDRPDPNIEFEYGQWLAQKTTRGYLLAIAAELGNASRPRSDHLYCYAQQVIRSFSRRVLRQQPRLFCALLPSTD